MSLKLEDVAGGAGISPSYLSLLERNKRDPSFSTIEAIAGALGVPVGILIFLAADPEELVGMDKELAEKLSLVSLRLLDASRDQPSLLWRSTDSEPASAGKKTRSE